MKKILAVLLALVAIGGFVFAEDAAPAAAAAPAPTLVQAVEPTVTLGATGSFGYNLVKEANATLLGDDLASFANKEVMQGGGASMQVEPWGQIAWGGLTIKITEGYKYNMTTVNPNAYYTKIATAYAAGGLKLYNNLIWDTADYTDRALYADLGLTARPFTNVFGLTFTKDNVSGEVAMYQGYGLPLSYTTNETAFEYVNQYIANAAIYQAWFQIKGIGDMLTVKAGDRINKHFFRMAGLADNYFTSENTIGYYSGKDFSAAKGFNLDATLDLSKVLKGLTVMAYAVVPSKSTSLPDYFTTGNTALVAKYEMEKVGTFDFGYLPSFDYTVNDVTFGKAVSYNLLDNAGSDTWAQTVASSSVFADANLSLVPNLTLQVGVDASFGQYYDAFNSTASVLKGVNYSLIDLGLEASYDLKDVVKGLTVGANLYTSFSSGIDYKTGMGQSWTDYVATISTATNYVDASYTEANYINQNDFGISPFQLTVKAAYALNDKVTFNLTNSFDAVYDNFQKTYNSYNDAVYGIDWSTSPIFSAVGLVPLEPQGYYGKDALKLSADLVAGAGTFSLGFAYNIYTGIPAASKLYNAAWTTAQKAAFDKLYQSFISANFNPWTVSVTYSISY